MKERYNVTAAKQFAQRIKSLGFRVFLAERGHYGFISDESGDRVLSFSFDGVENTLSGNYGPPSRESGTGWRMYTYPENLRTAEEVRSVLNAYPPLYCQRATNARGGWKYFTTLEQHLTRYGSSSQYEEIEQ
jgi:hypothetical protein